VDVVEFEPSNLGGLGDSLDSFICGVEVVAILGFGMLV